MSLDRFCLSTANGKIFCSHDCKARANCTSEKAQEIASFSKPLRRQHNRSERGAGEDTNQYYVWKPVKESFHQAYPSHSSSAPRQSRPNCAERSGDQA